MYQIIDDLGCRGRRLLLPGRKYYNINWIQVRYLPFLIWDRSGSSEPFPQTIPSRVSMPTLALAPLGNHIRRDDQIKASNVSQYRWYFAGVRNWRTCTAALCVSGCVYYKRNICGFKLDNEHTHTVHDVCFSARIGWRYLAALYTREYT